MKYSAVLYNPQQAHGCLLTIWESVKSLLIAGHRLQIEVKTERRSLEANAKFHSLCELAAKSRLPWAGKPRTAPEWKVLLVSGHSVATKNGAEIVPGLEGEFVNIRESTARMSRARSASLIEYTLAFLASHGVETNEQEREEA